MRAEKRWSIAQSYEKGHWDETAKRIDAGRSDLRWYRWKAERTLARLGAGGVALAPDATVVEIGSGPVGQVGFLPGARRFAFDPLMDFFEQHSALIAERPEGVDYVKTRGESLPLPPGSCDLVVIDNCIDHCEDPQRVLRECRRVLAPEGHLYLTVNARSKPGRMLRSAVESVIPVDRGHPYSYDVGGIRRLVGSCGFAELRRWNEAYWHSVRASWDESPLKAMLKVGTLTIERLFEGVWRRGAADD